MGHIKEYVAGIKRDLEHVIPEEGHKHVRESIAVQAERLGDIAEHNTKYLTEMMNEFLSLIERRHAVVDFREYDCWDRVAHKRLMKEFALYLEYGVDAITLFDDIEDDQPSSD